MVELKPSFHGICDIYRVAVPEAQSSLYHILKQLIQTVLRKTYSDLRPLIIK